MENKTTIVKEIKIYQEVTGINDISAITELGPEKNEIRMTTSMEKTEGVGTRNAEAVNTYTINTPIWQHQKSNVSQRAQGVRLQCSSEHSHPVAEGLLE